MVIWAHPRVGGENDVSTGKQRRYIGSSPRGRGKRIGCLRSRDRGRLIPAWAGKTSGRGLGVGRFRAHPRVGGENLITSGTYDGNLGSSPRGRGKRLNRRLAQLVHGLIPAWAGKTRHPPRPLPLRRAHPRVGGENGAKRCVTPFINGSSPRGRGKRNMLKLLLRTLRLIPAWAGKTRQSSPVDSRRRAHPRVGGEN